MSEKVRHFFQDNSRMSLITINSIKIKEFILLQHQTNYQTHQLVRWYRIKITALFDNLLLVIELQDCLQQIHHQQKCLTSFYLTYSVILDILQILQTLLKLYYSKLP